jgi:hypothetical protein
MPNRAQSSLLPFCRGEDFVQTAIDPTDNRTMWYVGDYRKQDAANYSSRIGAIRLPSCGVDD